MRLLISTAVLALVASGACAQSEAPEPLVAGGGFAQQPIADCKTDLRFLNQVSGWQSNWPGEWEAIAGAGENFAEEVEHWSGAPAALDAAKEKLRTGAANGEAAPRAVVLRVLQQVRDLAGALDARSARYVSADEDAAAWNMLMIEKILPAIRDFESFLEQDYLPKAAAQPGLMQIKDGAECYRKAVEWWTTLSPSRDDIEAAGKRILDATRADLLATAQNGETIEQIIAQLRAHEKDDPTTQEELIALSEAALDRAQANTEKAFLHAAPHPITVEPMAEHMQDSFPAGFYGPPSETRDAVYVINPSRPNERRLMAEVIAFHEGVPGHHLFFDYPRETPSRGFNSGLIEGWALYSEYVADEMGLYSTTLDRQGMMAKHLWAASRLVVEPGLHLRGWSRDDAINFMLENTVMSRTEIELEVDRYLAMPGQSLSYMLGADLLMSERERARAAMGDDFDIRAFHDVVLAPGVRPLPQVRDEIRAWAKGEREEG